MRRVVLRKLFPGIFHHFFFIFFFINFFYKLIYYCKYVKALIVIDFKFVIKTNISLLVLRYKINIPLTVCYSGLYRVEDIFISVVLLTTKFFFFSTLLSHSAENIVMICKYIYPVSLVSNFFQIF